jgi:ABC-type multidrug transport system fused ATPase/permease subunit
MLRYRPRHRVGRRLALAWLLRAYLRPHAVQASLIVFLLALQAAGNLYLPILNAGIINNGVVKGDTGYIWRTGGLMLGIALVVGVISVVTMFCAARVSMGIGATMRADVYRKTQAFSAREMSGFGVSSLVTRNSNDVQQIQMFLRTALTVTVTAVLMSVGGVIMAVREGSKLSLLLVVAVPAVVPVVAAIVCTTVPLFRSLQGRVDHINQVLREQITGVRVIRAFGRTDAEQGRFGAANADLAATVLRVNRVFAASTPVLTLILTLSGVGVIWFGGHLVSDGAMPIGNLIAFLTYIVQILTAVILAVKVVIAGLRAVASSERIEQVLTTVPVIADPPRPVTPARITGAVEFRHVTFGYPGSERPVLLDLTFALRPGQTSAIIGGTGSGKTTLVNLIPRLLDVTGGAVLVNGTDVRHQSAGPLRSAIGLVPQVAFLFRGTVASNLRFGAPQATDEQLWQALEIAQAADFVTDMPGRLDAPIDQGGTNVSGGQRQRLSIARALVRRPRLYLFDDCFSALDAATDARLRGALRDETGAAAVLIVSQRIGTIMHADQIIVLDDGRISGIGTHQQLLARSAPYREIAASQLGEGIAA